ncbi:MAG: uL15m family ribosomal protein [Candidatus Paceibacterota bacterium]|jgi:large subunit ribosomal protein L15
MQLHELKRNTTFKDKKKIGRGGKKGTYSGKGQNGQKSRAGANFQPIIRTWIKKYPKLRGYNFNITKQYSVIDVSVLEKNFEEKEVINPKILTDDRIVRRVDGKLPMIKILGKGEIKKPLIIEGCLVSKSAKEKIEKAGGTVKENK